MKYVFVYRHRYEYPVRLTCKVLEVSCSGYYGFLRRRGNSIRQAEPHCPNQRGSPSLPIYIWQSPSDAPAKEEWTCNWQIPSPSVDEAGRGQCEKARWLQGDDQA